jgi:hypothetical protein
MRLTGRICCLCSRPLDALLWQAPGERVCETCEAQRAPAPKLRRIHMSFTLRDRWYCTFMESDFRTQAAPARTFTSTDNMVEMIRRGSGFGDLASKQAVEHAIQTGRGHVDLMLSEEQYNKLARKV